MSEMPTGGCLGLDLNGVGREASSIGWAYGDLHWPLPRSGHWRLPTIGGRGARYVAFVNLFNDILDEWQPKNVYIEQPLPPNIPNTNATTMRQIYAVLGFVEEACWRASVSFSGNHVDTIRVDVIGRCRWPGDGNATKAGVIDFVRNTLKMDVTNHDECDAIIVWMHYKQKMQGIPSAKFPLLRTGGTL